jgi:hypothetical protein
MRGSFRRPPIIGFRTESTQIPQSIQTIKSLIDTIHLKAHLVNHQTMKKSSNFNHYLQRLFVGLFPPKLINSFSILFLRLLFMKLRTFRNFVVRSPLKSEIFCFLKESRFLAFASELAPRANFLRHFQIGLRGVDETMLG